MPDFYYYATAAGHGLPHDPLKAIVAPRPIGWISSCDKDGRVNLPPYSFFNLFASNPHIVGFSSAGRKDSVRNAEETGEFVANLAARSLAAQMNATSAAVERGVDEMVLSGLVPATCYQVKAPRVAQSPAALECKVVQILQLRNLDGQPIDTWLTLGQVVGVHIDKRFLKQGRFDTAGAQAIMRAGYLGDYVCIGEMFDMRRP